MGTPSKRSVEEEDIMEDVVVRREEQGLISVLTMEYRPHNLLGPTLIGQSRRKSPPHRRAAAGRSFCAVGCATFRQEPTSPCSVRVSNRAAEASRQSAA